MKSICRNALLNSKWGLEAREVGFEDGGKFCGFGQKLRFKFCGFGQKCYLCTNKILKIS